MDVEVEARGELAQVVAGAGLVDVYRSVEPQASGHTWRNSRGDTAWLDFLFVAEGARVQSCSLRPFWGSDHCMVVGGIELEVGQRGRGFWRLNTTVLQDPSFCKVFRHLYAGWRRLRGLYTTQIEWWEDLKRRVAILCHWWGQEMARRRKEGAETWSRELCEAWKAGDYGRLRDASEALRAHYEAEARSHFVQAGREALEQDERPTRYFFSSVRSRQRRSYIEGPRSGPDVLTSPGDMFEVARSFYNDLFGVRQTEDDCAAVFLDAVAGRMPEESVPDLEREISLEEVERAMLSLKTGVAPGGDGLPAEWYRTFWPVVGPDLLAVYREAVRFGALPPSALVGYVTLLYKKGDRTELANWRPITLLTVDYKILAKLMVLRLREVMARVVHPDQTCGTPGRMCGMNLALVRDGLISAGGYLTDRGVTDIGLKLHALREAFATHLACIDNQNLLFVMGKKIVMHLAAVNNQDAICVKLAYEDLIWFLKTPSYQDSIAAELSEAYVYHYNFVDVFYELLLFGYITNGSIPDTFEGGPLERLFVLISMWNVDVWEPAAKIYFTVLIDQLTDLAEVLFTQPPEFYYDPAALATTLRPLLRQHVQKMMDILEKL
ncbi:hypothetical protein QTP70_018905 [Hemibagrus guttatus]|uniref:Reverse transcriptase n=1 Tax=Hemibagrus guttatus TaxID=175788 RepID=A0AAE0V756_9TELE|nr:hypothetical protein QTP70_018905 [Hemibagrus guttatus]